VSGTVCCNWLLTWRPSEYHPQLQESGSSASPPAITSKARGALTVWTLVDAAKSRCSEVDPSRSTSSTDERD
jgi:hypothetical protein